MHAHHGIDECLGVLGVHLDIEHIDTGELLEQDALAFHDRLGGQRPQIAQAQDRRTITDHRHQIPLGGETVGQFRLPCDFPHRLRHPRAVGQTQIPAGRRRLGHLNADFSGTRLGMIFQSRCFQILGHGGLRCSLVGIYTVFSGSKMQKAPIWVLFADVFQILEQKGYQPFLLRIMPKRCLNLSIWPPLSACFCLPV